MSVELFNSTASGTVQTKASSATLRRRMLSNACAEKAAWRCGVAGGAGPQSRIGQTWVPPQSPAKLPRNIVSGFQISTIAPSCFWCIHAWAPPVRAVSRGSRRPGSVASSVQQSKPPFIPKFDSRRLCTRLKWDDEARLGGPQPNMEGDPRAARVAMAGQPLKPKLPHGNQPKPSNLSDSPKPWMNEREPLPSRVAIPWALPIRRGTASWMENEDKRPPVMRPSLSGGSSGVQSL